MGREIQYFSKNKFLSIDSYIQAQNYDNFMETNLNANIKYNTNTCTIKYITHHIIIYKPCASGTNDSRISGSTL